MSYANVVATVAMVFAMTGGAYAASKVLITSTKQIKPSVLAQLKGKAGPAGAAGTNGVNGKDGAPGAQGPKGETGNTGGAGPAGKSVVVAGNTSSGECPAGGKLYEVEGSGVKNKVCNGAAGAPGPEGNIGATLNPGATETGTFLAPAVESEETIANVSFTIPLAQPGLVGGAEFFVTIKEVENRENATGTEEAPGQCPGTSGRPEARRGNLCLYEGIGGTSPRSEVTHATFVAEWASGFGLGAGPAGSLVLFKTEGNTLVRIYGSWAVTAG